MFVDDCADALLFLMEQDIHFPDGYMSHVNVGSGEEISIRELALIIADVIGYGGKIVNDTSKPDGTPRKLLDCSFLKSLGWGAKTPLREGLKKTYDWYVATKNKRM